MILQLDRENIPFKFIGCYNICEIIFKTADIDILFSRELKKVIWICLYLLVFYAIFRKSGLYRKSIPFQKL